MTVALPAVVYDCEKSNFALREEIRNTDVESRVQETFNAALMNTSNLLGGEAQPAHKADIFTAICEPIV
jgi:hypothetical protein